MGREAKVSLLTMSADVNARELLPNSDRTAVANDLGWHAIKSSSIRFTLFVNRRDRK